MTETTQTNPSDNYSSSYNIKIAHVGLFEPSASMLKHLKNDQGLSSLCITLTHDKNLKKIMGKKDTLAIKLDFVPIAEYEDDQKRNEKLKEYDLIIAGSVKFQGVLAQYFDLSQLTDAKIPVWTVQMANENYSYLSKILQENYTAKIKNEKKQAAKKKQSKKNTQVTTQ